MSKRTRKIILQNNNVSSKNFAKKLSEKGYVVLLKFPDEEEAVPFPF